MFFFFSFFFLPKDYFRPITRKKKVTNNDNPVRFEEPLVRVPIYQGHQEIVINTI